MRLVITGTPCTGKTTLAEKISRLLGVPLIKINDVVAEKNLFTVNKGEREKTVKMKQLEKELAKRLSKLPSFIIEGHLACEFSLPADKILVLRASPEILERRMAKRKYSKKKISENLLAECLDYCLLKAEANYPAKKIVQFDASKPASLKKILSRLERGESDPVNWFHFLVANEKRLRL